MTTKTTAEVHLTKKRPPRWRLEVTAKLYQLEGNERPYFSVTCEEYENGRDVGGGAAHELILEHFPELEPVVRVHLADDRGRPMHAEANALYWAGFSPDYPRVKDGEPWRQMKPSDNYGRTPLEQDAEGLWWSPSTLAKHLRVSEEKAREIRAYCVNDETKHYSAAMHFCCQMLEAQWQEDADAALATIRRLSGGAS